MNRTNHKGKPPKTSPARNTPGKRYKDHQEEAETEGTSATNMEKPVKKNHSEVSNVKPQ